MPVTGAMSVLKRKNRSMRAKRGKMRQLKKRWGQKEKKSKEKKKKAQKKKKVRKRNKIRKQNKIRRKNKFDFFSQIVVSFFDCLLASFLFIYFPLYA